MKKYMLLIVGLFAVVSVVAMVMMPTAKKAPSIYISGEDGQPLADSIMKIVKVTCMDCHADGGNGMASAHINFSKWSTYKPEKQAAKAKDICKVISKGSMPPKKFRENNPTAVPTPAQVTTLCNWANALNK